MPDHNLSYRIATIDDAEQLRQLSIVSYGQFFDIMEPEYREKLSTSIHDLQKVHDLLAQSTCFVCEHDSIIVGMAYLVPHGHPWDIFKSEWCYMRMVGVNPAYQGRGIARTLIQQCIDRAISSGEKTMALHTSEFMDAARHIYESFGFTILQDMEPRFGKRYWLYTKQLS